MKKKAAKKRIKKLEAEVADLQARVKAIDDRMSVVNVAALLQVVQQVFAWLPRPKE